MEFFRSALFPMKIKLNNAGLILSVSVVLFFCGTPGWTQPSGVKHASDFTSVEYFASPHQQQIKSRLSGAEAQPQAGGLLVIKQLKLETFDLDGKAEFIVEAPECVYDTQKDAANSSGYLKLRTGDGKFRVEGEGFLWRQNDSFLTISNQVRTVIETGSGEKTGL